RRGWDPAGRRPRWFGRAATKWAPRGRAEVTGELVRWRDPPKRSGWPHDRGGSARACLPKPLARRQRRRLHSSELEPELEPLQAQARGQELGLWQALAPERPRAPTARR